MSETKSIYVITEGGRVLHTCSTLKIACNKLNELTPFQTYHYLISYHDLLLSRKRQQKKADPLLKMTYHFPPCDTIVLKETILND